MKKIKLYLFQTIANTLFSFCKNAKSAKTFTESYRVAMSFNNWCLEKDIYLK